MYGYEDMTPPLREYSARPAILAATLAMLLSACQEPNQPAPEVGLVAVAEADRQRELGVLEACNLEMAASDDAPAFTARMGRPITVSGWIANAGGDQPAALPVLRLARIGGPGVWEFALTTGEDRPDVAQGRMAPGLASSGFHAEIPVEGLAAGDYSLVLLEKSEPQWLACDNGRVLRVVE